MKKIVKKVVVECAKFGSYGGKPCKYYVYRLIKLNGETLITSKPYKGKTAKIYCCKPARRLAKQLDVKVEVKL